VDPYLDVAAFKLRTVMPSAEVDYLEAAYPGYLLSRLTINSSRINGRLGKRYATPFAQPAPEIVCGWLVALTTVDGYEKRGWDPAGEQRSSILEARDTALEEMKEAADAKDGLFDIPLREDLATSGIARGEPLGCSDATPYDWIDTQAEAARGR
jgi:hypothetical protein